jgi:hypothetical protein
MELVCCKGEYIRKDSNIIENRETVANEARNWIRYSPSPARAGTYKHKYRNRNGSLFSFYTVPYHLKPLHLPFSLLRVHVDSCVEFQYTIWNANELDA